MTHDPALALLKALANPSRLRLIAVLRDGPRCVEDLAGRLDLAPSTVSHHLKVLSRAGLVRAAQVQYYSEYEVVERVLDQNLLDLVNACDDLGGLAERRAERARRAVVRAHVRDGRVTRLPAGLKKRRVVLEAMAADLDPSRLYTVDDLLATIGRRFADPDLVRREWLAWGIVAPEADGLRLAAPVGDLRLPPPPERPGSPPRRPAQSAPSALVGVAWIRNRSTERVFLLGSANLHASLNRHRARLQAGTHPCEALQDDWQRFGPDGFDLEILETLSADQIDQLGRLEQAWLAGLQPFDEHCYNERRDIRDDLPPAVGSLAG
ncbi:MAG: metalloregulator ArsR/SmtB family transcription factor [Candidatus Krumholzibacteriia bacterium]